MSATGNCRILNLNTREIVITPRIIALHPKNGTTPGKLIPKQLESVSVGVMFELINSKAIERSV